MTARWSVPLFGIFLIASVGAVSAAPIDVVRDTALRGFDRHIAKDRSRISSQPDYQVAAQPRVQLARPGRTMFSGDLSPASRSYSDMPNVRHATRAGDLHTTRRASTGRSNAMVLAADEERPDNTNGA
jgi:hypothetical protein